MKLAVVGLDSADWTLLDRWLDRLPHIAAVRREGISGPLETCKPPVTIPAWKCYATGKNPGKLGVFWFARPDFDRRSLELNLPGAIPGNLWDLIPRSLVVNVPGTYPPRAIDGVLIAGFPCPDGPPSASPAWMLPRLDGYRPGPSVPPRHPGFPKEAMEVMRVQFGTFERLAPRFRFGQLTLFHIDELHHLHGSDSTVLDAWRLIDEGIGRIMAIADNVLLVSDHGSGPMRESVNIVPALVGAGALRLRKDRSRPILSAMDRIAGSVPWAIRRRVRDRWILPKVRDAIRTRIEPLHEWLPAASVQIRHRVDWSSAVIPLNGGLVYRNPGGKGPAVDPEDALRGLPGVRRVWRRADIYRGPYVRQAPDLWVEAEPGIELVARFGESWERRPSERGRGWIVNHRPHGIFGFLGKDVDGARVPRATIYDMAPSILSLFGIPPPPDTDGVALPVFRGVHGGIGRAA